MRTLLAALICGVMISCGGEDPPPPPTTIPDVEATPVRESFTVNIELSAASSLAPVSIPARGGESLGLRAFAKRVSGRPGLVWLELFVENRTTLGLRDATLTVGSAETLYDLTTSPFAEATSARTFPLGGVAAEGLAHLTLGVPEGTPTLEITVAGVATARRATASARLALTPDGAELWAPFPDANRLAVIDTARDARVAELEIPGHPESVAITPDGALVLVASARGNALSVIDRKTRRVVQSFGEGEGIGREPRHVVVSPDGGRAFVSAYVGDVVTALVRNGDRYRVERVVAVGRRPTGLAVSPDSTTLLVSHFLPSGTVTTNEAWLSVLAADEPKLLRKIAIHDHFNLDRAHCFANVFGVSKERITTEGVASELAGVFFEPGGHEAWVPGTRIAGATIAWERGPKSVELSTFASIRTGELAAPFLFLFDARKPRDTDRLPMASVVDPPDANEKFTKCAEIQAEIEMISRDMIPSLPGQQVNRAAAFPSPITGLSEIGIARFIAFTRGGRRALVVSHMSDEIAVIDAATHHPSTQRHFALEGSQPSALVVTPDGRKGYVAYDNSAFVSVLDLSAYAEPKKLEPSFVPYEFKDVKEFPSNGGGISRMRLVRHVSDVPDRPAIVETTKVELGGDGMDPKLRRGKILFESSNPDKHPTLTKSRLGACASCHPDGGNDGTLWGTMEGERRTMSLRGGVAGRGWLHASGTHKDIEEFATIIAKERLGGELGHDDIEALGRYVAFGIAKLQPPRVDAALAAKGKVVFENKCSSCHQGAALTSGSPDEKNPWGGGGTEGPELFDVKTSTTDAKVILGSFFESLLPKSDAELFRLLRGDRDLGAADPVQRLLDFRARPDRKRTHFKAPALVNVWDNVLFFHDGRYARLEDAVHHLNEVLRLKLSSEDETAVCEYLKTL